MGSEEKAKERLITDLQPVKCCDPERAISDLEEVEALHISNERSITKWQDKWADTQRNVDRLKEELATTQEQLRETQISNANWRERFTEQAKRIDTINAGRKMDVDSWRGKLAKANVEIDRQTRAAHNAKAFGESWKTEAKRWKKETEKTRAQLAGADK